MGHAVDVRTLQDPRGGRRTVARGGTWAALGLTFSWWLTPMLTLFGLATADPEGYGPSGDLLKDQEALWSGMFIIGVLACAVAGIDGWLIRRRLPVLGSSWRAWGKVVGWLFLCALATTAPFVYVGVQLAGEAEPWLDEIVPSVVMTHVYGAFALFFLMAFGLLVGIVMAHWFAGVVGGLLGACMTLAASDEYSFVVLYPATDADFLLFGRIRDLHALIIQGALLAGLAAVVLIFLLVSFGRYRDRPTVVVGIVGVFLATLGAPSLPVYPYDWVDVSEIEQSCANGRVASASGSYEVTTCLASGHAGILEDVNAAFIDLHKGAARAGIIELPRELTETTRSPDLRETAGLNLLLPPWAVSDTVRREDINASWLAGEVLVSRGCSALFEYEEATLGPVPDEPYGPYLLEIIRTDGSSAGFAPPSSDGQYTHTVLQCVDPDYVDPTAIDYSEDEF